MPLSLVDKEEPPKNSLPWKMPVFIFPGHPLDWALPCWKPWVFLLWVRRRLNFAAVVPGSRRTFGVDSVNNLLKKSLLEFSELLTYYTNESVY